MKNKHDIFVVDDHPLTRKGLCDAINAEADMRVCAEAEGYHDAVRGLRAKRPDVLILDLNLKDGNGWTLLQQLGGEESLPPTLILSVCDEEVYARRLLDAGARGYLMKDEPIRIVLEALRRILAGHLVVSATMTSLLLRPSLKPGTHALSELSDRELQVYEMLCQGLSNKTIGERLSVSPKTIGTYKARLMEKMGVRTTSDLFCGTRS